MAHERAMGFEDLVVQMRITNALLVRLLEKDHEVTQSQIAVEMSATGASAQEIARILGTTANTIQVALSRGRRRRRDRADVSKDG